MKKRNIKLPQLFNKTKYSFVAAGCTALVMLGVYLANIVYPIGINSILCVDLYHQYAPLFAELWDKLMSGGSLLYSWQSGGGAAWLGNFFNYLSSPFTFIICLFPRENITEAIALIVLLKSVLASFTFSLFINKKTEDKTPLISAFGVLYSCCGWFVAYYWDVMWLDALYLLPLVALGIEKLIDSKKSAFYIISLALTFLTNYYMAYMVCIFSVAYFLYYFFSNNSNIFSKDLKITFKNLKNNLFINRGFNFAFSSFGAVLICSVALLPVFISLSSSSATGDPFPKAPVTYFNIFDFLVQHLTAIEPTVRSSAKEVFLPNVSCGVLSAILLSLFFLTKNISKKEKILSSAFLGFLFAGFYINYLDFIWHGFHSPNDLPFRFSFMYSFVLLLIAFRTLSHIKEIPVKYIKLAASAFIIFLLITQKLGSENFTEGALWINLVFVIIYSVILLLLANKKYPQKTVAILLLILVCTEYTIGNSTKYEILIPREDYIYDYSTFSEIKKKLDKEESFYRMELLKGRPTMAPCLYGFNGVSFFTSMANEQVAKNQKLLGMQSNNINSCIYNTQTPVYNAFFGIKYILNSPIGSIQQLPADYFELINRNIDFTAYKNNYSLPLGFAVDEAIINVSIDNENPFVNQSKLFKSATGVSKVFENVEIESVEVDNLKLDEKALKENNSAEYSVKYLGDANAKIDLKAGADGEAYIYIFSEKETVESVVYSSNENSTTQDVGGESYIFYVGKVKKGDSITATVNIPLDDESEKPELAKDKLHIYGAVVNKEKFEEGYNKLKKSPFNISEFDDTHFSGTVTMPENSILYTSINFDKGWHVTVDGVPADDKIIVLENCLTGIDLDEGEHTIEFTFVPEGLYEGLIVSFVSIAIGLIVLLVKKRKIKDEK